MGLYSCGNIEMWAIQLWGYTQLWEPRAVELYSCDWSLVTEPSVYTMTLRFAVGFLNEKLDL